MRALAVNPILPGFHPDPSICRVGDDFYLVTSTFEYFPGLPIHTSRDLANWTPLGHVLDRPSQLPLEGVRASGGLYAPTIRWHRGVFYVVCTLVGGTTQRGNFVVTATDAAGPWSEPIWLGEEDSFDPSLLFDGDDAWFCATRPRRDGGKPGQTEVWVQRFDPATLHPGRRADGDLARRHGRRRLGRGAAPLRRRRRISPRRRRGRYCRSTTA